MAWYPKARRRPITRFRQPMRRPVRINYHTAVTNAASLFDWFNVHGRATSHFYVDKHGNVEQYIDTAIQAAADLQGNPDTISIETWDGYRTGAPGYWAHNGDVPPWTDAQVAALRDLTAWLLATHPSIPARIATDSKPGASSHGLSWHRLGCDGRFPNTHPLWGRRAGGLKYSNAYGKGCPGDRRIVQVPSLLSGVAGVHLPDLDRPTTPEERPTMRLIQSADKGQVAVTDGVTKRYLPDPKTINDYKKIAGDVLVVGQYTYDRIPNAVVDIPAGVTAADVVAAVREALASVEVDVDEDAVADSVVNKLAGRLEVDVTVKGA